MRLQRKLEKLFFLGLARLLTRYRAGLATKVQYRFYSRWGMKFAGAPNYISPFVQFDGTDYGLIELGRGVTLSSYIRVLTHDWSLHTISKAFGVHSDKPLGRIAGIRIGDYSFVGTGSILMPGCEIGRGCIIGAGTVVRGRVPDFSIYIGSPGAVVGNTQDLLEKHLQRSNAGKLAGLQSETRKN